MDCSATVIMWVDSLKHAMGPRNAHSRGARDIILPPVFASRAVLSQLVPFYSPTMYTFHPARISNLCMDTHGLLSDCHYVR